MGMFDSVYFNCPECGEIVEVQSKAGDCFLAQYTKDTVPPEIASDIAGKSVRCSECKSDLEVHPGEWD